MSKPRENLDQTFRRGRVVCSGGAVLDFQRLSDRHEDDDVPGDGVIARLYPPSVLVDLGPGEDFRAAPHLEMNCQHDGDDARVYEVGYHPGGSLEMPVILNLTEDEPLRIWVTLDDSKNARQVSMSLEELREVLRPHFAMKLGASRPKVPQMTEDVTPPPGSAWAAVLAERENRRNSRNDGPRGA